jgi:hypothetical protein
VREREFFVSKEGRSLFDGPLRERDNRQQTAAADNINMVEIFSQ